MSLDVALQYALTGSDRDAGAAPGHLRQHRRTPRRPAIPRRRCRNSRAPTKAARGVVTGDVQRVTDKGCRPPILREANQRRVERPRRPTTICSRSRACSARSAAATRSPTRSTISRARCRPSRPRRRIRWRRLAAVNAGQQLAQQLNSLSSGVQTLRQNADGQIATDVGNAQHRAQHDRPAQRPDQPAARRSTSRPRPRGPARPGASAGRAARRRQSYTGPTARWWCMTTQGQTLVDGEHRHSSSATPSRAR